MTRVSENMECRHVGKETMRSCCLYLSMVASELVCLVLGTQGDWVGHSSVEKCDRSRYICTNTQRREGRSIQ